MPFDYNSFLQGVQTGLRLGRTSPGRVPPMPPVPSGRYILTESGEKIITETLATSEATLYQMGQWYSYPDGYTYQGGPLYGYFRIIRSVTQDSPVFFYARLTDFGASEPVCVVWRYQDHASPWGYRAQYTSNPSGGAIVDLSNYQQSLGWYYVENITYTLKVVSESTLIPIPDGTQIFEGSLSEDLPQFLLSLKVQPIITE